MISAIYLVMRSALPPKRMRLGCIVLAAVLLAGFLYYAFMPLGLVWFLRTGGWDKWRKMLEGHITAEGAVAFPVRIQWDFVDLTVKPQSSPNPPPTDEVIIRVVNARRQPAPCRSCTPYIVRSCCSLSWDVRRFLPVIKLVAVLTILFGLWLIALDVVVGMPWFWTVSEGPSLFILYCVEFWLTGRVQTERK